MPTQPARRIPRRFVATSARTASSVMCVAVSATIDPHPMYTGGSSPQSARKVRLRTSVSSLRASHAKYEHLQEQADAKKAALCGEIAALRASEKKYVSESRHLRWRLTNHKLVDIKAGVMRQLISTGKEGRAAFAMQRAFKLEQV